MLREAGFPAYAEFSNGKHRWVRVFEGDDHRLVFVDVLNNEIRIGTELDEPLAEWCPAATPTND